MSHVKPLGHRVIIKRSESRKSTGGILLPDSSQEKPKIGDVIAVGPGEYNKQGVFEKPELKVGDRVLFSSYGGCEINSEQDLIVLHERDVLAVLER